MKAITYSNITGIGDPVIIFTFGRSGTHMTIDLIRRHFPEFAAWKFPIDYNSAVYTHLDRLVQEGLTPCAVRRMRRAARPILMTHDWPRIRDKLTLAQPDLARWITERGQIVHVLHNPKYAMSSAWPIENDRARRANAPMSATPDYVRSSARRWADHIKAMLGTSHLRLRYEDILKNPAYAVQNIAEWIGATPKWRTPIMARPHASVTQARLARLLTVNPASSAAVVSRAVRQRYRLDWTPSLEAILHAEAGPELIQLGYANSATGQAA